MKQLKALGKLLFYLLIGSNLNILHGQELSSDSATLLLLHFNNSTDGANSEMPIEATNLSYQTGMIGSAIEISNNSTLNFDTTQNIDTRKGSIEFWLKPEAWGTVLDMGIAGGLSVQIGDWTRMIFNIYGLHGNPEVGVINYRGDDQWALGQWSHFVFTWGEGTLRFYINGQLREASTYNFELPLIDLGFFSIGSKFDGFEHFEGLIDELRISNRVRSAQEVFNSYFMGLNLTLTTFGARSLDTIKMYETWNVYLQKPGFWKVPELYLTNGIDTVNVSNAAVSWSVSDTSIIKITSEGMTAVKVGSATLMASFNAQSVSIPVTVKKAIKAPTYESTIDPFLTKPANCAHDTIPVLIIAYIPTLDSINLDLDEIQFYSPIAAQTVALEKAHILNINRQTKFTLEEGSKFRGYSDPNALPYLGYKIVDYITVYESVPRGVPVPGSTDSYFTDFNQIVKRFNGQHYVEDLGVKEIWILGVHSDKVVVVESNMSSPTTGDISNSYRHSDDLPIYNKTYIVYNYNITRTHREAVHNHGHQLEAMCTYVAQNQDGNTDLFWKEFVGWNSGKFPSLRVGDTHHPPNTLADYDYINSSFVLSDIMDWKPAGGLGTLVNKDTWGDIPYNWPALQVPNNPTDAPDEESNWYLFWMQSFPGYGNKIPYGDRYMTNWWRFVSDWDNNNSIGLHQANLEPDPNCVLPKTYVNLKAILGGAYFANGDTMTTALRSSGILPTKCPYDTTVVLNTLPATMVDWVRIELTDTLTGDITYASQCACVLRNGAVQNINGDSTIELSGFTDDFISLRIKHRNHLSTRSRSIANTPGETIPFDFRNGTNLYVDPTIIGSTYHNVGLPELLTGSRYALWPGDANGDGQIKYQGSGNDRGLILTAVGGTNITNTVIGYLPADFNLNGQVKYQGSANDRGIVLSSIGGLVITKVTKAHD